MQEVHEQIVKGIQKYFGSTGLSRVVVGISGGIDSALTLKLAVDALGADKVTAISMPEIGLSNPVNAQHAKIFSQALGVTFYSQPINQYLQPYKTTPWKNNDLANINIKARIRAVLLYHYANTASALVLGTSNKSEIFLGYGTKFGDLAADIEVIGDLFKEDVYKLADYLGLPKEFLLKKPSAELVAGQTDEAELGASYAELDPILKNLDLGLNGLIDKGFNPALVHNTLTRIQKNAHKAEMPPTIKVKFKRPKLIPSEEMFNQPYNPAESLANSPEPEEPNPPTPQENTLFDNL